MCMEKVLTSGSFPWPEVTFTCYQLSKKSNPVFRMLLLVLYCEKAGLPVCMSSSFSLSLVDSKGVLGPRPGLNTSSTELLTDGSVL